MRNSELIAELKNHPMDAEVIIFADGVLYPSECISELDLNGSLKIEISCGLMEDEE